MIQAMKSRLGESQTSLHSLKLFDQFIVKIGFKSRFLINFTVNQTVSHDFDSICERNSVIGLSMERIKDFTD